LTLEFLENNWASRLRFRHRSRCGSRLELFRAKIEIETALMRSSLTQRRNMLVAHCSLLNTSQAHLLTGPRALLLLKYKSWMGLEVRAGAQLPHAVPNVVPSSSAQVRLAAAPIGCAAALLHTPCLTRLIEMTRRRPPHKLSLCGLLVSLSWPRYSSPLVRPPLTGIRSKNKGLISMT